MPLRHTLRVLLLALALSPLASAQVLFRADLTGTQEVPPVTTTATGLATAVLDGSTLILRGQFEGLESDYNVLVGSHIHEAPAGMNGDIVFSLDPALADDSRSGQWFGPENRFELDATQIQALRDENFYVNVHTVENGSGEIRGQLTPAIVINEVRADQPGGDDDEYVELSGPAGASLDGFSFIVIGDGAGGIGVIEEIIDLSGQTIPDDGYFLFGQLTLATPDLDTDINLENTDAVTYLLVEGVPGAEGDDLDVDDDGVLDTTPWDNIADAVGLANTDPDDATYAEQLGFEDIGPDGTFRPAHVFRNRDDGVFRIGSFAVEGGFDTPGEVNASTSLVQIIHNSPDATAQTVDVYVGDALASDDLAFRTATPFVLLDAGTELELTVAPASSTSPEDGVFDTTVTLDGSRGYYVVASGLLGDNGEPDDDFTLAVYDNARRFSTTPGTVDLGFFNGAPDAPSVDLRTGEVAQAILFNDVSFGAFAESTYQPLGPSEIRFELSDAGGAPLALFDTDLTGLVDQSALLLTSGFEDPSNGDADLSLLLVQPDGTTATFAVPVDGPATARGLSLDVANPVQRSAEVRFETAAPGAVSLAVYDARGRRVADLAKTDLPAGAHLATWDASGLAPGVYLLRLGTEAGTLTRTVSVVR